MRPVDGLDVTDSLVMEAETDIIADGYLEEHGRIWGPDGRLLAHFAQHVLRVELN